MKCIKKSVMISLVVCLIFILYNQPVYSASDSFVLNVSGDEAVKPGKTFNSKVTLSDTSYLGSVLIAVHYPDDELILKSVSIDEKNKNEFIRYADNNGEIRFIYAVSRMRISERNIILKFDQKYDNDSEYRIECEMIDGVNYDCSDITNKCKAVCTIAALSEKDQEIQPSVISTQVNREISQNTQITSGQKRGEKNSEIKNNQSVNESIVSAASGKPEKNPENTSVESSIPIHTFDYEKYQDNLTDNEFISYTAGIIIIIVIVIIAASGFVRRINKKYPD